MFFTSMALGMILSVSWGVKKEMDAEEALENTEEVTINEGSEEI